MSRASSGQSIRVGSQVYQINITPQEGFQFEFQLLETKLGYMVRIVLDSILLHAEFEPNEHRKDRPPLKTYQIEIPFKQLEKRNLEKQRERRIRYVAVFFLDWR